MKKRLKKLDYILLSKVWVAVVLLVLLALSFSRISPYLGFAVLLATAACVCFRSPAEGICVLALVNPFSGLIRNAAPSSLLLAGVNEILLLMCIIGMLKRDVIRYLWIRNPVLMMIALYVAMSTMNSVRTGSLVEMLLNIRAYVFPALTVFIVYFSVKQPEDMERFCGYLLLASCMLLTLYAANYLELLPMEYAGEQIDNVLPGSGRDLGTWHIERGLSLIGGGASAMALWFAAMVPLSLGLAWESATKWRTVWWLIWSGLFFCATLTLVSKSSILFWLFWLAMFIFIGRWRLAFTIVLVLLMISLFSLFVVGDFLDDNSIIEVVREGSYIWSRYFPASGLDLIVGQGLQPIESGRLVRNITNPGLLLDGGWVAVINMQGLLCVILWAAILLQMAVLARREYRCARCPVLYPILCAVVIGLAFSSVHTVVLYRQRLCFLFFAACGLCSAYSDLASSKRFPRRLANPRIAVQKSFFSASVI